MIDGTNCRGHGRFMRALRRAIPHGRSGVVAIQVALLLSVVIGFAALGSEIVFLLYKQRQMQSAADSAALAGATALMTGHPADFTLEVAAVASVAGFTSGIDGVTITVNHPPASGPYANNMAAVEVIIAQPQTLYMASLFGSGLYDVGGRAVAVVGTSGIYCVFALDPGAPGAVTVKNNAVLINPNCGIAVNSGSGTALVVANNAAINGPVLVHGGWSLAINAALNGSPISDYAPALSDPYTDVSLQTTPSCTGQSGSASNNVTVNLNPGHFCSGWNFSNGVTLNLAPGAYYIDQQLSIMNGSVINGGGGVTLILNGNYAMSIGNNANVSIVAPSSGPYAGLAVLGSRAGQASTKQTFSNNTTLNITGAIYFPNQTIEFDNNSTSGSGNGCTQVIGRIVNIQNNVWLDNHCAGTGVKPIGVLPARIVE